MKEYFSKIVAFFIVLVSAYLFASCSGSNEDRYLSKITDNSKKEIIKNSLEKAGNNSDQILEAIKDCPDKYLDGILFLIENMPERDLKSLSSKYLLNNIDLAYSVLDSVKWGNRIPTNIFQNYILPYANLHERRDDWRNDFNTKFLPLVRNLQSSSEAVEKLNDEIWDILNVHYSTKRPKADQSPYESVDAGLASCTGLSILLIDACRSVGIPARFVGVPLWKDQSGNHSWVEIWDNDWHYIGAAEQGPLDNTWFGKRAALADDSNWKYSIYATSFKKTNVIFPPLFDTTATYVYSNIITDRYNQNLNDNGLVTLAIRLFDKKYGKRIKGKITVKHNDIVVGSGESKNEKYDFNDFLVFQLKPMGDYKIIANVGELSVDKKIRTDSSKFQFCELFLSEDL